MYNNIVIEKILNTFETPKSIGSTTCENIRKMDDYIKAASTRQK